MKDSDGRYIIFLFDIIGKPYTLVGVYAPNTLQLRFFGNLIICEDFSLIVDPQQNSIIHHEGPFSHMEEVYNA